MKIRHNRYLSAQCVAAGLIVWLCGASSAAASQVLSGGSPIGGTSSLFTAPGVPAYTAETAAQIVMPSGVLRKLRVNVVSFVNDGSGGRFTVMVRINNADTPLTCSVRRVAGTCETRTAEVRFTNGSLLAIKATNGFAFHSLFTYTLILN